MKKLATLLLLAAAPVFAQPDMQEKMPDMSEMFMQQFDRNRDGKVTLAEFLDPSEKQFRQMDANGDGVIVKAEMDAFAEMMRERMERMRKQHGGGQER